VPPSASVYALLGLTALVAALAATVAFAVLRFVAAARDTRRHSVSSRSESAFFSTALQEAVKALKAQERATAARAEASERLSGETLTPRCDAPLASDSAIVRRNTAV
jgi:hypothetical protein